LKLVDEAVDALGEEILSRIGNVAIVTADEPSAKQREENGLSEDEVLFGLYEGIPQTERGITEEIVLPDKITIFKLPILAAYETNEDIAVCIKNTVWHEVAHHFGMDEEWVRDEEIKRGKLL